MIFENCPVNGSLISEIGRVADQTFPFLVLLDRLQIFAAQVPPDALAAESMGAEVTEIDLSSLRTPPGRKKC